MKIFRLFSIAAAALMMSACSTEDSTQQATPGKLHFTATIAAPNSGAGTRTEYTEDTENKKITVAWKVGDEIVLVHDKVMDVVKVKTVNADGSATIDGTITSATDEATVQLVYPAARVSAVNSDGNPEFNKTVSGKLLTQDGTLDYIQNNIDFRDGEGQLSVNGTEVTLKKAADMVSSIAIWKLTLQDNAATPAALAAKQVKIKSGGNDLASTAVLTTGKSTLYLAVPVVLEQTITIEATVGEDTYSFTKNVTLNASAYYQSTVTMAKIVDLSTVTDATTIKDGYTVTGTLDVANHPVQISIAAGATVTLDGVTINGVKNSSYKWAGITCVGDATIILKDGTTNTVKGFKADYPGIFIASGKTLTIKGETAGTGSLNASSNGSGAGIGGGYQIACGNIEIQGGTITATGGSNSAGIGSGRNSSCGNITISGGSVTATGGANGAGIGSGYAGSCGNITITSDVTSVTATKGDYATNSIGAGAGECTCGTVTIGCTLDTDGNPVGGTGTTGAITQSPYEYSAPPALTLTTPAVGQVIGSDGKNYPAASVPSGVTAVAMIAYVSGSNGLAIALADESSYMDWETAKSTCEAKTPAFTGGTWKLPSLDEWKNMLTYDAGSYKKNNLKTALSTAGGNALQEWMYYWSSTDYVSDNTQACDVKFQGDEANFSNESKTYTSGMLVRAVLAF